MKLQESLKFVRTSGKSGETLRRSLRPGRDAIVE